MNKQKDAVQVRMSVTRRVRRLQSCQEVVALSWQCSHIETTTKVYKKFQANDTES